MRIASSVVRKPKSPSGIRPRIQSRAEQPAWRVPSRDATGQIQGQAIGNGLLLGRRLTKPRICKAKLSEISESPAYPCSFDMNAASLQSHQRRAAGIALVHERLGGHRPASRRRDGFQCRLCPSAWGHYERWQSRPRSSCCACCRRIAVTTEDTPAVAYCQYVGQWAVSLRRGCNAPQPVARAVATPGVRVRSRYGLNRGCPVNRAGRR